MPVKPAIDLSGLARIRECLESNIDKFNGIRVYLGNTELKALTYSILDSCGIRYSGTREEWRSIYYNVLTELLLKRPRRTKQRDTTSVYSITPAAAIYIALYQIYGKDAPERIYNLLEEMITNKLRGLSNEPVQLLFVPITPATLEDQLKLVERIVEAEPVICETGLLTLMCSVSKSMHHDIADKCKRIVTRVCRGVKH